MSLRAQVIRIAAAYPAGSEERRALVSTLVQADYDLRRLDDYLDDILTATEQAIATLKREGDPSDVVRILGDVVGITGQALKSLDFGPEATALASIATRIRARV